MPTNFTKRYNRPLNSNKEYVTKQRGGWSQCIQGSPTDAACDVLANCVGFACGRFNEIYNEIMGTTGMRYPLLNCNAENFIERAKQAYPDLVFSSTPRPGAIICWAKGKAGVSSDGAGHVAVVEEVIDDNTIVTSESAYAGTAFYVSTRKNDNGRWGMGSAYSFRAFILNPAVEYTPVPTAKVDKYKDQIEVKTTGLRMREQPGLDGRILGHINPGRYDVIDLKSVDGYTWYSLTTNLWVADYDHDSTEGVEFFPKTVWIEPVPVDEDTKVNQVHIGNINLRIREDSSTESQQMGVCKPESYYNVYEVEAKSDFTWYKIGNSAWVAGVDEVMYYPFVESSTVSELKEKVKRLENSLELEKQLNEELRTQNNVLDRELTATKEEVKTLQQEAKELKSTISLKDATIKEIKKHNDAITQVLS